MKTTNELVKRLKGYHKTFRGRYLLLMLGALTDEEFILLELGFSVLVDWDKKNHPDNYGSFGYTQEEIGSFLKWDKSKVSRTAMKLIQKGFWGKRSDGRITVIGYEIQEHLPEITREKGIVNLQEYILKMQLENAKIQQINANLQPVASKGKDVTRAYDVARMQYFVPKEPLVSSKGNSSILRSNEEYQRRQEEGGYTMLTIDDMKWIDKNI